MDPKSGLRPYLQMDVDDILDAIIDDQGNVSSQIKIVVNGRERLVNIGLIQNTMKFVWGRGEEAEMGDTINLICETAFPKYTYPIDTIPGAGAFPRQLLRAGLTKRNGALVASLIWRRTMNGEPYGPEISNHLMSDTLTKYQQTYIMHLLLAHGKGGHAGHGMADWDFFSDLITGESRFELRN